MIGNLPEFWYSVLAKNSEISHLWELIINLKIKLLKIVLNIFWRELISQSSFLLILTKEFCYRLTWNILFRNIDKHCINKFRRLIKHICAAHIYIYSSMWYHNSVNCTRKHKEHLVRQFFKNTIIHHTWCVLSSLAVNCVWKNQVFLLSENEGGKIENDDLLQCFPAVIKVV